MMLRNLILVPTECELKHLQPRLAQIAADACGLIAVCGFGPITSGICTTRLIARHAPKSVILVGIAGALGPQLHIGVAQSFSQIGCYGIGAGSGSEYKTAGELGWNQWTDAESTEPVGDIIQVPVTPDNADSECPMLLTVCAASANAADVADRLRRFPRPVAEDMEAFSVAVACRMAQIPLTVVRGISNHAGDRDKSNWNVAAALEAAAELTASRILR